MTVLPGPRPPRHLTRTVLAVGALCGLIAAAAMIVEPFLVAGLWAVMIVVASWPVMLWLQQRLWGRRWLAVTVLTVALLLLLVLPVTLAVAAAVINAGEIAERAKQLGTLRLPTPPEWVASLPLVGAKVVSWWEQVAAAGVEGLLTRLQPYAGAITRRFLAQASGVGFILLECLLALAFAALLYLQGEAAASLARRLGRRLAGPTGEEAVTLATQAIRGVALGIGGTAVVQSVLTGLGLAIAGVPFAALLTFVTFVSCIAQIGTPIVLGPAVIWVYYTGETGWGTFLLVWAIIIGTADNVLRPLLIQRGVDLPFWLVFTGVVGGLFAFGLVGLFIGPVVLAVASMLLTTWLDASERPATAAPSEPGAPG
jgi:predicted PurR-regulated permease PerM